MLGWTSIFYFLAADWLELLEALLLTIFPLTVAKSGLGPMFSSLPTHSSENNWLEVKSWLHFFDPQILIGQRLRVGCFFDPRKMRMNPQTLALSMLVNLWARIGIWSTSFLVDKKSARPLSCVLATRDSLEEYHRPKLGWSLSNSYHLSYSGSGGIGCLVYLSVLIAMQSAVLMAYFSILVSLTQSISSTFG